MKKRRKTNQQKPKLNTTHTQIHKSNKNHQTYIKNCQHGKHAQTQK